MKAYAARSRQVLACLAEPLVRAAAAPQLLPGCRLTTTSVPASLSSQVRIEQVLMSSPPPLLCFRLSQLLAFYLATVEALLGPGSQLAGELECCVPCVAGQAWQLAVTAAATGV